MPLEFGALSAYRGAIKASGARAPKAAGSAVNETGAVITSTAKGNAPVVTGDLVSKIHWVRTGATSGEVRSDSGHAAYVEEGTSVMAAEPYLGPAADAHEDELPTKLLVHVAEGL